MNFIYMPEMEPLKIRLYKLLIIILLSVLGVSPGIAQESEDSLDTHKASLSAYPYAYYTPETQLAIGAGGVFTFYTERDSMLNPSKVTFSGFYSTIKTYELSLTSNLFFARNKMASTMDIRYSHKVDRFYGVGNDTPDLGTEEYVLDNVGGMIDFQIPANIVISDRAGLVLEYRDYSITDTKENPYLNSDIPFPGKEGGVVSGVGLIWVWDNRDQIFFPNSGGITEAKTIFYTKDMVSDFTFSWVEINARRYWSLAPDQVIAAQIYLNTVGGKPPFFKLPALGGSSIMRGYFQGRYRDFDYLALQVEYRQYFWRRWGFVLFAGTGDVAEEITSIQLRYLKPTYGFGLRFLFDQKQKINLRMDIGFGLHTNGIYFGIEEAF